MIQSNYHHIHQYILILIFLKVSIQNHNDLFYNIFLKNVTDLNGSGASEYEIYFNYMRLYLNLIRNKMN